MLFSDFNLCPDGDDLFLVDEFAEDYDFDATLAQGLLSHEVGGLGARRLCEHGEGVWWWG